MLNFKLCQYITITLEFGCKGDNNFKLPMTKLFETDWNKSSPLSRSGRSSK